MNVPKGWQIKKIQDDFETFSGGTPSTSNPNYYGGNIPWIRSTEINQSKVTHTEKFITEEGLTNSSAKLVYPGYLLLALYGATAGEVAITEIEGAINQAVLSINNTNQRSSNSYLYYYLSFYKNRIINKFVQGGQPNLSGGIIKNINFLAPPLEEQQKIASILSTWDEAIELQRTLIDLLTIRLKGLLQKVMSEKDNWEEYRLDEISDIYQPQTLSAKDMQEGPYRVFGANGYIGYHNDYNHENSQVTVSCRGENTGTVNLVDEKCWITGNSMVLNVEAFPMINKKFLYYYLKNQNLKYLVTGSGQPQIIRKDIASHRVNIPSINKQNEIVEILEVFEKEIMLADKLLKQLQEQKRGLMQLLLTGKVRV